MKNYFNFSQRVSILWLLFLVISLAASAQDSKPKNIIIMIGDGMGLNYVSASVLSLEDSPYKKFNSIGLSVTCSADNLITDSAAAATAVATGYRTDDHLLSLDPNGKVLKTIFEKAEELNKSTGVVVTSSVTHATPAAFLSHVDSRYKQNEIAEQIYHGKSDVIIGGGKNFFKPLNSGGKRDDNINLADSIKAKGYNYYENVWDLFNSEHDNKIYALLDADGLLPASKRTYSLGELTTVALNNLSKNENGFILMIEGSQIDWAGHDNETERAIEELKDFDTAINVVLNFIEKNENTLVVITADHETGGMSITGGTLEGDSLKFGYTSKGHTAEMVGVFAKGPGEELFRGVYDNHMIGRKLFHLLDENYQFWGE